MSDLNRLGAPTSGGRIGHQLRLYAPIHGAEEIGSSIDALPDSEDAVILQDDGLLVAKGASDIAAFFVSEHDAAEIVVDGVVVVEAARVLVDGLEFASQGGEGFGGEAVAVDGGYDVGTGLVDCEVDREARRVDGVPDR